MYSYNLVLQCLNLYKNNKSCREIEKILNISKSTASLWIFLYYDNYSELEKRYLKQHKNEREIFLNTLNKEILDFINNLVISNPFMTYNKFISQINDKYKIKLNNKKLKFIFNKLDITKKRIRRRVIKSKDFLNTIILEREKFKKVIEKELYDNIICIDETGFNTIVNKNTKGFSKKGKDINIPVSSLKINNQSLLMAISLKEIIHYVISDTNTDKLIYFNFIKELIDKLKKDNKKYIFIFDNVPFHHADDVLNLITSNNFKYFFIPPYSPNLNPIENVNGIIKDIFYKEISNDNVHLINFKSNKENNKNITIQMNDIKNNKIANNKKNINDEYNLKIENIKNNKELKKENIKEQTKEMKNNKKKEIKEMIKKEKDIAKKNIKENKKNISNTVKQYIIKSITNFNINYDEKIIKRIYQRAFSFNHEDIEKELRDRITFI